MLRHILKMSILAVFLAASCSQPDGVANDTPERAATPGEKRMLPEPAKTPAVNRLVEAATTDLLDRLALQGADPVEVKVLRAENVTWRSAALGCPRPDRGYMMVLTPGVLIRLRAANTVYEYHSTLRGPPFLCEPPGKVETPAPPGNAELDPT